MTFPVKKKLFKPKFSGRAKFPKYFCDNVIHSTFLNWCIQATELQRHDV